MTTNVLINPTIPDADQKRVSAIFDSIESHLGFVPAGLKLYSISPPLLEAFVGTVGYFMSHERLSQKLLAFIRYLVSSDANCHFCIDFNSALLMNMGVTADQLEAARIEPDLAPLESGEKTLLKIALAAIDQPEAVTDADIESARAQGYGERDVFDAVVIAANNKAFTHVLRTFKVEDQAAFA
ncbi:carboxymuconolactone decarboxylase family protein [Thiolapillus sp.]